MYKIISLVIAMIALILLFILVSACIIGNNEIKISQPAENEVLTSSSFASNEIVISADSSASISDNEPINFVQPSRSSSSGYGFSDEEDGDSRIGAGILDLKVNGQDNPRTLFSLGNMVPGDNGIRSISVENVGSIDGLLVLHMNFFDSEGRNPEPETNVAEPGDLSKYMDVTIYYNNQVLVNQTALVNVTQGNYNLGLLNARESKNLKIEYNVGFEAGNDIQGDEITFDFEFDLNQY